ncbi:MAG TPA: hypothetical protein VG815_08145 [Chloroflexota bacterium]|nr:hypothetical protein [Chloroflexota bacterium]
MSRVNERRTLEARVTQAENSRAYAQAEDRFAKMSPSPCAAPCSPEGPAIGDELGSLIKRLAETNDRLRERARLAIRPVPSCDECATPSPPVSMLRLLTRDLHAAIGRLNETIDAIDL